MKYFIPKGTRDFSPIETYNRNFLIKTIKKCFKIFGFYPLETPSIENISTLNEKYGEEVEFLIFKILNSGNTLRKGILNFLKEIDKSNNIKTNIYNNQIVYRFLSNKALRYDLTVPFIRYIIMNKNRIFFPFKRYQIQPVWRSEKPQKGRFREFYQSDADIVSRSYSLWSEIELIKLCDYIFTKLNLSIIIYINHIYILKGIVELIGIKDNLWKDFIIILDKWNKIGENEVKKEMLNKGITLQSFNDIKYLIKRNESFQNKKKFFEKKFQYSNKGKIGLKEISFIYETLENISLYKTKLKWNISLARGINYYTGIIWEIIPNKQNNYNSIGGGGRYDKLINLFGMKNIYGTGISFGLDRIYLAMEKENLFKINKYNFFPSKIMFINFGDKESIYSYKLLDLLRKKGISTQLYPNVSNINKQFKYAYDNNIKFVIMIGENEIKNNKIKMKNTKNKIEVEYNNINDLINDII
ncbi:histidine--tRNA ligase [Blattabacterium cuenoti]|uniref:histidine--tRNA ligase n=1 Tax=Blattabacterium cuenoti TaxID=1653831 RepID=UPI00163D1CFD|nr:histidine--tRNA ligase [Blattabacterium cuenoti]